jgi:S1-C subfamily serine protease
VKVVVPRTGRTYGATVVGYSVSSDTALLRLKGASGLATISVGSGRLSVGQRVRAVGNAGGTGSLTTVRGTITGLSKTITVRNDQGVTQRLAGLIETNADLRPGDSGGPLLDAGGHVIGMDTAASTAGSGFFFQNGGADGYAIPISKALQVAHQIEDGRTTPTVHVGPTPFLGIQISPSDPGDGTGALVAGIVPGSPAERAGLEQGDEITSFDGKGVATARSIAALILQKKPGASVTIAWTTSYGSSRSARVTLVAGPPQ